MVEQKLRVASANQPPWIMGGACCFFSVYLFIRRLELPSAGRGRVIVRIAASED
jgi:hypothetical protein